MKRIASLPLHVRILGIIAASLIFAGLALSAVYAAPGSTYSLSWYTFDGGGGNSNGSGYTLMGTIGQPDAGLSSGSEFSLTGGFWTWMARYLDFLPMLRKP